MSAFVRSIPIPLVDAPRVVLDRMRPLVWRAPPAPHDDLPPIVRAGSAVRRWRDRWCIVQDEVRALALLDSPSVNEPPAVHGSQAYRESHAAVAGFDASSQHLTRDPRAAAAVPLLLPASPLGLRTFDDTRGNKAAKLDLEAAVALPDGRLLVFGSGATPVRERIVVIDDAPLRVRIADAHEFYAHIHAHTSFGAASSTATIITNVEGAVVVDRRLRLFHRAVGRTDTAASPHAANLTLDFDLAGFVAWLDHAAAAPHVRDVVAYDLGFADGAVVGFTDATLRPDGTIAFLACAELTGDPVVDGRVTATRFGVLDGAASWQSEIVDGAGDRVSDKLEGLEPADAPDTFVVVSDSDDPALPARIAGLRIGPGI